MRIPEAFLLGGLHEIEHFVHSHIHAAKTLSVSMDATVGEVLEQLIREKLTSWQSAGDLRVMQNSMSVNTHCWRALQYHHHKRHGTTTISLRVLGLTAGEESEIHLTCKTSVFRAHVGLLHGGLGTVGNYCDRSAAGSSPGELRDSKPLSWFLSDAGGRDLLFREYFVQTSHNTVRERIAHLHC